MVKVVKYTTDLPDDVTIDCAEKVHGCEKQASLHVCFEDGSGASYCRQCFDSSINEGGWTTDSTQTLLAS